MMTTEEKLQHFTMYAMEEARNKSNTMLREYTDALEKIFQEHKEKKKRQADLEIKTETARLVSENNKQASEAQIEIRRMLSKRQAELKDKLFVEVKDMLARFAETREMCIRDRAQGGHDVAACDRTDEYGVCSGHCLWNVPDPDSHDYAYYRMCPQP